MRAYRDRPDYRFVEQSPLGTNTRGLGEISSLLPAPLGRLAHAIQPERLVLPRALGDHADIQPQIMAWTWWSMPAADKPGG
jgi:hypothetical protein